MTGQFRNTTQAYREMLVTHNEVYSDTVWTLAEAVVAMKKAHIHAEDRYTAMKEQYTGDEIEQAESIAQGYMIWGRLELH